VPPLALSRFGDLCNAIFPSGVSRSHFFSPAFVSLARPLSPSSNGTGTIRTQGLKSRQIAPNRAKSRQIASNRAKSRQNAARTSALARQSASIAYKSLGKRTRRMREFTRVFSGDSDSSRFSIASNSGNSSEMLASTWRTRTCHATRAKLRFQPEI